MTRWQRLKVAFWYHLSLYGPTSYVRYEAWLRWMELQWVRPIDRDTTDTGVDDPRLA